jgi:hypothetical protein
LRILKSYLVYFIALLMLSTSALYFIVSTFGESVESSDAHGLQLVEGQEEEETEESEHNEAVEESAGEVHNETGEPEEQHLEEEQELQESSNESEHIELEEKEEGMHDEASENQRTIFEFPLFVSSGIGYAAIGIWMILDKGNNRIPYIIAIVGSIILLGIYVSSRTIGISNLGLEPVGLLDSILAGLQVAIIATSLYVLINKINAKGTLIDK